MEKDAQRRRGGAPGAAATAGRVSSRNISQTIRGRWGWWLKRRAGTRKGRRERGGGGGADSWIVCVCAIGGRAGGAWLMGARAWGPARCNEKNCACKELGVRKGDGREEALRGKALLKGGAIKYMRLGRFRLLRAAINQRRGGQSFFAASRQGWGRGEGGEGKTLGKSAGGACRQKRPGATTGPGCCGAVWLAAVRSQFQLRRLPGCCCGPGGRAGCLQLCFCRSLAGLLLGPLCAGHCVRLLAG